MFEQGGRLGGYVPSSQIVLIRWRHDRRLENIAKAAPTRLPKNEPDQEN
jgi:hypothetical protein